MKALRNLVDKIKPTFSEGGKLSMFRSVFDGFETFLFVPNETSKSRGAQIHDAADSKRLIFTVIIALIPALLFGMYNVGLQHYNSLVGANAGFWDCIWFGFLAFLPKLIVTYLVGLGIEFTVAQFKGEEIHEGFLVTGFILPMIVPVECPLWILAIATAFAVVFAKEIFGGTGMNIFNPALIARAFLFFAYPSKMSGDSVWVRTDGILGLGEGTLVDGFSGATPLGNLAAGKDMGYSLMDCVLGYIPGSIGETSVIAIAIGAAILIFSGVASWKIVLSTFAGGALMGYIFNVSGMTTEIAQIPFYYHLVLGGFAFGAVFMATDPVTAARTECGKWVYGLLIGMVAVIIRVLNPGYPEGMMLAILLMNCFAPLIDYCVVSRNIAKRAKRANIK